MLVFAWIVFVFSILAILAYALTWFGEGEGFFGVLQSVGLVVYCIFYLFVSPFGTVVSWVFFGVYCAFFLLNLLLRRPFGTLQCAAGAILILLVVL